MTNQSHYSVPLLIAFFLSILFIASAFGILVWALGWGVLVVLGGAFVIFVVLSIARDFIVDARQRRTRD